MIEEGHSMAWLRTPSRLVQNPRSGSSFFFQVYIPKDLTQHLDKIKSFRISLQSGTKAHSSRLSRNLSATVDTLFNEIRSGMRLLTISRKSSELKSGNPFCTPVMFIWAPMNFLKSQFRRVLSINAPEKRISRVLCSRT